MKFSTDLTRQNTLDLTEAFVVANPVTTPLTSLLYSRGKNYTLKEVIVRKKMKTLSDTNSGGRKEGADAPSAEKTTYAYVSNTMEIFSKAAAISGTTGAIAGNIKGVLAKEINDRLIEIKGDMENAMINGVEANEETEDDGRAMNGLINLVDKDNVIDASVEEVPQALTEDHILDALQKMHEAGQTNGELFLVCNATTKRKINKLYQDQENATIPLVAGNGDVGIVVQRILTDFGVVNIVLSNNVATGTILLFNLDLVEVPELRAPQFIAIGVTGDNYKGQVVAESTIITYPKSLAKIINFI